MNGMPGGSVPRSAAETAREAATEAIAGWFMEGGYGSARTFWDMAAEILDALAAEGFAVVQLPAADLKQAATYIRYWSESDNCDDRPANIRHLKDLAYRLEALAVSGVQPTEGPISSPGCDCCVQTGPVDPETGRWTCCGTDALSADPFHAAGCPQRRTK